MLSCRMTEHTLFLAVKLTVKEEGSPGLVTGETIAGSEAGSCLNCWELHGEDCPVTSNRAQHIVGAHEQAWHERLAGYRVHSRRNACSLGHLPNNKTEVS